MVREVLGGGFLYFSFTRHGGPPLYSSHGMYWAGGSRGGVGEGPGAWVVPSRLAKYNTESMGITVLGMAQGRA